jgi:diguanylate cyclase (GGDEF)-like protein
MGPDSIKFLKKVEIFSLLTDEELHVIVGFLRTVNVGAGEILFREGDEGHELYIMKSGKIRVAIALPDGHEKDITEFVTGDFFGEMSIFENAPRSATCTAQVDSSLYYLRRRDFYSLVKNHPSLAIKLMYRMSNITTRRLRSTGEFLSDMVLWGEDARKRAITDELTGVYNRHFLEDALENQFRISRNRGTPLTLIMVDLDHFRSINETYGHDKGDEIILAAISIFKKYLRDSDVIARYGGDEFTVLLPNTALPEGFSIAQNICEEISSLDILEGDGYDTGADGIFTRVTTSQGVAAFPENAGDLGGLMKKADEALYRAKELGRNRVECAGAE